MYKKIDLLINFVIIKHPKIYSLELFSKQILTKHKEREFFLHNSIHQFNLLQNKQLSTPHFIQTPFNIRLHFPNASFPEGTELCVKLHKRRLGTMFIHQLLVLLWHTIQSLK